METSNYNADEWNEVLGVSVGAKVIALLEDAKQWEYPLRRPVRSVNQKINTLLGELRLETPPVRVVTLNGLREARRQWERSLPPDIAATLLGEFGRRVQFLRNLDNLARPWCPFDSTLGLCSVLGRMSDLIPSMKRFRVRGMVERVLDHPSYTGVTP